MFAIGTFTQVGNIPANKSAKWEGNKWCSLGSNFNGGISKMCVFNNEIFIIGSFTGIDGQTINHIAKWVGGNYSDSCQSVGIDNYLLDKNISVFPSPSKDIINIYSDNIKINAATIFDIIGREIPCKSFDQRMEFINVSLFTAGIYFINLKMENGSITKKIIIN